ncbi:MAG: ABC transporter permease subunit [Anaerolineales bacterium]|nr:ABC transporter permease subunit [Anaerolineales bacterium]
MARLARTQSVTPLVRNTPRWSWDWLGVVPFFLFIFAFLLMPSGTLFLGAFQDGAGAWTIDNIVALNSPQIIKAYSLSLQVSLATSLVGGIFGFLVAYAITVGGTPGWLRSALLTFSGLAANFGGVPLAFAFIATVGRTGFVTALLKGLGLDLYEAGFSLYGFFGLTLAYTYFQFPLMVLTITPALDGLKREWREASANLGASSWEYWWHVALPILWPSILGTMILLFGSAFGAFATAQALTGGQILLVTILIGQQIRGDVLGNANLGYALALGMVVVMGICIAIYTILQRQTTRWLR